VIVRDLTTTRIAPVDAAFVGAIYTPDDKRSAEQKALLQLSDTLIGELETADEYVFSTPMHNFGIAAVLKLWIDQIARVNKTFSYATGSPVGLLKGKKATILFASGGTYEAGSATAGLDFVTPYLRAILGFIGISDVTVVNAGGAAALSHGGDRAAFLKPHLETVRSKVH